jgi:hypothetical protein
VRVNNLTNGTERGGLGSKFQLNNHHTQKKSKKHNEAPYDMHIDERDPKELKVKPTQNTELFGHQSAGVNSDNDDEVPARADKY